MAKVGNVIAENSIAGSGSVRTSKKRYAIISSSWSAEPDASNYYTYTVTLSNPELDTSYAPNIYIAGSTDSTFPTQTERDNFNLLNECNLSASTTLVLYATVKPTATFYVFIEGVIAE